LFWTLGLALYGVWSRSRLNLGGLLNLGLGSIIGPVRSGVNIFEFVVLSK
jgi:hypothetical protein